MEPSSRRHHQRSRSARGPPPSPLPPHHPGRCYPPTASRLNPSVLPTADAFPLHHRFAMEDDAISTLMDIDDSPLNGAGFLDEEDGDGEMFLGAHRARRGGGLGPIDSFGPLPFTGFFNSFDGADFDDADLE